MPREDVELCTATPSHTFTYTCLHFSCTWVVPFMRRGELFQQMTQPRGASR